MSDSNTQPLTPEQQEALQAQNEIAAAAQEQYEQIKQDLTWKIAQIPVKEQGTALTHDTAKVDLDDAAEVVQVGRDAYEIKTPGYNPPQSVIGDILVNDQAKKIKQAQQDALLKAQTEWQNLLGVFKPQSKPHEHGPFTWLLNANHNALRGCKTCGQTWTGLMSGVQESDLRWHEVQEVPEEEE